MIVAYLALWFFFACFAALREKDFPTQSRKERMSEKSVLAAERPEKLARRKASGKISFHIVRPERARDIRFLRALFRTFGAGSITLVFQTFHVWLFSSGRFTAQCMA